MGVKGIAEEFYKGYVITKNKKPITKFSDESNLLPLESVTSLPEFAGVMASDAILIDIDDMAQSELLLRIIDEKNISCRVQRSRSGMHFLFKNSEIKNCPNRIHLAIGITADIKSGYKNSYEVLKIDGQEREIEYDKWDDEEYSEVPKWLFPVKTNFDFLKMGAGDGRNQSLFAYILVLQKHGFSIEEIKETITIINEYVFSEPLSQQELDVILRDEAFQKLCFYDKNGKINLDLFCNFLKNKYKIKRINGQLHMFKDGIYIYGQDKIEAKMIEEVQNMRSTNRNEVWKYMNLQLQQNAESAPRNYIAFRNGVYDTNTGKLQPFSPDIVITNQIPWDYNPNAYSALADNVLNKLSCGDTEIRSILEECIGSCFYRSNTLGGGKAFILTGGGSNGKSTFISMLQNLLSEDNMASLDLKELDMKFQNTSLFGKLANLGDDISDEFIVNVSVFKKLVTGNRIQVQNKGEKPFEFNNYAKFLFSANEMPRIKDNTGAVLRRLIIIPFNAKFTPDDPDFDPDIMYKLQSSEVMEYLIKIGLEGLKRVIKHKKYSESAKANNELKDYERMINPVLQFVEECNNSDDFCIDRESTQEVYERYDRFCHDSNLSVMGKTKFTQQLKKYGYDSIVAKVQGKSIRVYVKIF